MITWFAYEYCTDIAATRDFYHDLVTSGFLTKTAVARGKQGRYSLTELGLSTVPLLVELGRLGARIDPATSRYSPALGNSTQEQQARLDALRDAHLAAPSTNS